MLNALKSKQLIPMFTIMAVLLFTALACGTSATAVPQIKEVEVTKWSKLLKQSR